MSQSAGLDLIRRRETRGYFHFALQVSNHQSSTPSFTEAEG
jgi:hypothetical protein